MLFRPPMPGQKLGIITLSTPEPAQFADMFQLGLRRLAGAGWETRVAETAIAQHGHLMASAEEIRRDCWEDGWAGRGLARSLFRCGIADALSANPEPQWAQGFKVSPTLDKCTVRSGKRATNSNSPPNASTYLRSVEICQSGRRNCFDTAAC